MKQPNCELGGKVILFEIPKQGSSLGSMELFVKRAESLPDVKSVEGPLINLLYVITFEVPAAALPDRVLCDWVCKAWEQRRVLKQTWQMTLQKFKMQRDTAGEPVRSRQWST